jgi:hypothetical protein
MQVNLRYHPDAFHNLSQALEPRYNIEYSAQLLARHFALTKSWERAVARYHSATPHRGSQYAGKVIRAWKEINQELRISKSSAAEERITMRLNTTQNDG